MDRDCRFGCATFQLKRWSGAPLGSATKPGNHTPCPRLDITLRFILMIHTGPIAFFPMKPLLLVLLAASLVANIVLARRAAPPSPVSSHPAVAGTEPVE